MLVETTQPRPVGAKLSAAAASLAKLETVEKDHGRLETRRYYQSAALDWFADRTRWAGLQSVGLVEAIREIGGQRSVERRYYLASLPLGVATFARAVRGHWGGWRTNCTGCWTCVFGKIKAGRAPVTQRRT